MPRPGYRVITISDEVYELISKLRKKYRISSIELLKTSLKLFDEFMEKCEQIHRTIK